MLSRMIMLLGASWFFDPARGEVGVRVGGSSCHSSYGRCTADWKQANTTQIPSLVSIPQSTAPPRYAVMIKPALFLGMLYALAVIHPYSKRKWARFPKNSLEPPCLRWVFADAEYSPKYFSRMYYGGVLTSCSPPRCKLSAKWIWLLVMVSGCTNLAPACAPGCGATLRTRRYPPRSCLLSQVRRCLDTSIIMAVSEEQEGE